MARKGGFFAELQRQAERAAKMKAQSAREAERAHMAALRLAEQTQRANDRAAAQQARADAAEQKRLAKEALEQHVAAMEAEVVLMNATLSETYQAIDSLLKTALEVDPFVDLKTLYVVAEHPPFDRTDLEKPLPEPNLIPDPIKPTFIEPDPPKGLSALFGKRKHEEAVAEARLSLESEITKWQAAVAETELARQAAKEQHARNEATRLESLEAERTRYACECAAREEEVKKRNEALDALIANLGYGTVDALEEYVSLVFSNSHYPDEYPVEHGFEFDPESAELRVHVSVISPDEMPHTNAYKYNKSSDEITESQLPTKVCKERYNGAIHQIALRTLSEVFRADRRGLIKTISLQLGTNIVDPATGRDTFLLFIAVGAERESFLALELANVVPAATLAHLGSSLSKSPFDLMTTEAKGIRRS
jgi:restriction system protein